MFYRRKIILALLQVFGGTMSSINLYKLLLIVSKEQKKPEYDFVPYLYGCYSFSLHADLDVMCSRDLLKENEDKSLSKIDEKNYLSVLKEEDKRVILSVHNRFANSTSDDLIRYTYVKFPFTAIKSQIAERLLSEEQLEKVKQHIPKSQETILFTIGYEGISLEEYLNRLLINNVNTLVDVRRNPLSMKFGFSKSQLRNYCYKLGIDYVHIPEVGIQSELRQKLNNQADYDKLFYNYKRNSLLATTASQQKILELLQERKRIALTCFEANICQCHRKHLSEAITQLPGWNYQVNHI